MKARSQVVFQLFLCILAAGITLYAYIDKQNELTQLRLAIPALMLETKAIQEENACLQYEIDRFESPIHLMELARQPEYSYLRFPSTEEVISLSPSSPGG